MNTRDIVIQHLNKLGRKYYKWNCNSSPKDSTIEVQFRLRVPRRMADDDFSKYVKSLNLEILATEAKRQPKSNSAGPFVRSPEVYNIYILSTKEFTLGEIANVDLYDFMWTKWTQAFHDVRSYIASVKLKEAGEYYEAITSGKRPLVKKQTAWSTKVLVNAKMSKATSKLINEFQDGSLIHIGYTNPPLKEIEF